MKEQSPNRETGHEAAIADFLDWLDRRKLSDAPEQIVDASARVAEFLAERPNYSGNREIAIELEELVNDSCTVQRLTAEATLCWIGDFAAENSAIDAGLNESLPRRLGEYELLERIGHGGMGIVYKARQSSLQRVVCVKMLPPGMLDAQNMQRLADEARLAGGLQHPGIVGVFDAGEVLGQPYYAMEYVAGETLAELIAREPLETSKAVDLLQRIAEAVDYAHTHGVLHRDLKPANVLLDAGGRPRVTDFGLALRLNESQSGAVAGTPAYMAPEQASGGAIDERTDVYGLGAILYEMLTGRPPFVGNTPIETLRLVELADLVSPRQLRAGLARDLDTICCRCLEKRPSARYCSVAELRDDLSRFLGHEPIKARPVGVAERMTRWTRRHPASSTAIGSALLALVLVGTVGTLALVSTQEALSRTETAEQQQRELAGELAEQKQRAEDALYRSQIARIEQSLEAADLAAARDLLDEIELNAALSKRRGLEWSFLHRKAWPEVGRLGAIPSNVRSAVWTRDGQSLITIDDGESLRRWTADGKLVATATHRPGPLALALDPQGEQIATVDTAGILSLWRVRSLEKENSFNLGSVIIRQLVWCQRRRRLVALDSSGVLVVVDEVSGIIGRFSAKEGIIQHMSLSRDGRLAVALDNRQIAWCDAADIFSEVSPADHTDQPIPLALDGTATIRSWATALAWSGDGQYLAAADEAGTLVLWRFVAATDSASASFEEIFRTAWSAGFIRSLAWLDGQLLIADSDGWLSGWSLTRYRIDWRQPTSPVRDLVADLEGSRWVSIGERGEPVSLWDRRRLTVGRTLVDTGVPVRTVASNLVGDKLASRDVDGNIVVWDCRTMRMLLRWNESALGATALAWSPSDDLFVTGRESEMVLYRADTGAQLRRWQIHSATVWTLAFSPDGRHLAGGDGKGLAVIVDTDDKETPIRLDKHTGDVHALVFSPDGSTIATADAESTVRNWSTADGRLLTTCKLDTSTIHTLRFLDASSLFAADGTGQIWLVDVRRGRIISHWTAHQGAIWSLLVIRDKVISTGQDRAIRLSDYQGRRLLTLGTLSAAVWGLTWERQSDRIFASTAAGEIREWTFEVGDRSVAPRH